MIGQTKRQMFYEEIRKRQKEELFANLRKKYFQQPTTVSMPSSDSFLVSGIIQTINQYPPSFFKFPTLYHHEQQLVALIQQMKSITNVVPQFIQFLQFQLKLVQVILGETKIQEEVSSDQIRRKQNVQPLETILTPIKHFIYNLLAEDDGIVLEYLPLISQFTKYKFFIDCFHNILLNTQISLYSKSNFFSQFLRQLQQHPEIIFDNCSHYITFIYYALYQKPGLAQESQFHYQIIDRIESVFNYLSFSENSFIQKEIKSLFYIYAYLILEKITNKRMDNCIKIVKGATYIMKQFQNKLKLIGRMLSPQSQIQVMPKNQKTLIERQEDDRVLEEITRFLCFFQNLSYFDEICYEIFYSYPSIWVHFIRLYYFVGSYQKKKRKATEQQIVVYQVVTEKILKIIGNMIVNLDIFEDLVTANKLQEKESEEIPKFIESLNIIFNVFSHNDPKIKLETLYVFNNTIGGYLCHLQNRTRRGEDISKLANTLDYVMAYSSTLTFTILRLDESEIALIQAFSKNLYFINNFRQDNPHIQFQFFFDTSLTGLLADITFQEDRFANRYNEVIRGYLADIINSNDSQNFH